VAIGAETEQERRKRHHQRSLFDGVAPLYEASRLGYPSDIIEFVVTTAALGADSTVLEVGCGTGQLTELLASFGFSLTAIDIGPSMIAGAEHRLDGSAVSFQVASFEDFAAAEATFDLIVSGAAFHWLDPEVRFCKSARLLRPGGWLALLDTEEHYDDPFGAALLGMWAVRGDDGGAWVTHPADSEVITGTGLFEEPLTDRHHQSRSRTRTWTPCRRSTGCSPSPGDRASARSRYWQGCSEAARVKVSVPGQRLLAAAVHLRHGLLQRPERGFAHRQGVDLLEQANVLRWLAVPASVRLV
jgi:SAM-dependent methyltransferase